MRRILLIVLIFILIGFIFMITCCDIPALSFDYTYKEISNAYKDYERTVRTLKEKNNNELKSLQEQLRTDFSDDDTNNVINMYTKNKQDYEDLVGLQQANFTVNEADIYNIEYVWAQVGDEARKSGVVAMMDIAKSDADLDSSDYVLCNLDFEIVGDYSNIAQFIYNIESNIQLSFQINDFFIEGYEGTSRNQDDKNKSKTENKQTDVNNKNKLKATFRVYNVPINRANVTEIKGDF